MNLNYFVEISFPQTTRLVEDSLNITFSLEILCLYEITNDVFLHSFNVQVSLRFSSFRKRINNDKSTEFFRHKLSSVKLNSFLIPPSKSLIASSFFIKYTRASEIFISYYLFLWHHTRSTWMMSVVVCQYIRPKFTREGEQSFRTWGLHISSWAIKVSSSWQLRKKVNKKAFLSPTAHEKFP